MGGMNHDRADRMHYEDTTYIHRFLSEALASCPLYLCPCFCPLPLCFPLLLPFGKFPLAFLAFVESEDIRQDAAGDCFNLVLGNVGVVDYLFSFAQMLLRIAQEYAFAGV